MFDRDTQIGILGAAAGLGVYVLFGGLLRLLFPILAFVLLAIVAKQIHGRVERLYGRLGVVGLSGLLYFLQPLQSSVQGFLSSVLGVFAAFVHSAVGFFVAPLFVHGGHKEEGLSESDDWPSDND